MFLKFLILKFLFSNELFKNVTIDDYAQTHRIHTAMDKS